MRNLLLRLVLGAGTLLALVPAAQAQVPRTLSYQGYLTDQSGATVADGTYGVTFRLYDGVEAPEPAWAESRSVEVVGGYFSTFLGVVNPLAIPFDRAYFLSVQMEGQEESDRSPLSATPYSLMAGGVEDGGAVRSLNGVTGAVELVAGEGIEIQEEGQQVLITARTGLDHPFCTDEECLDDEDFDLDNEIGVYARADAEVGRGVFGFATSRVGVNYGVFGLTKSDAGHGVYGWANALTGATYGVLGKSDSPEGFGVYGTAPGLGVVGLASVRSGMSRGVFGEARSEDGIGVSGEAPRTGVQGLAVAPTTLTRGVYGEARSVDGAGVYGEATAPSGSNFGVYGLTRSYAGNGVFGTAPAFGVNGYAWAPSGRSYGVYGSAISDDGRGTFGLAPTYGAYGEAQIYGVFGSSKSVDGEEVAGVYGKALSPLGYGVYGTSERFGVYGIADTTEADSYGVYGIAKSPEGAGVYGKADTTEGANYGVYGISRSTEGYGVYGLADTTSGANYGVYGETKSDVGVGVYGVASGEGFGGWFEGKGYFDGDLIVQGAGLFDSVIKAGGIFLIDHPLDPENKLLAHSFVESPEMMNIYAGNVTTDGGGFATVTMPDWFEPLNRDVRYQLTVIGQFAQAIIAEEIQGTQFVIQTDKPNVKVSWQVTGVRQDAWAEANRFVVERDKEPENRGRYLHPAAYGQPVSRGMRPRLGDLVASPGLNVRRYGGGGGNRP